MLFEVLVYDARDGVSKKARIRWGVGDDIKFVICGPCPGTATLLVDVAAKIEEIKASKK